MRGVVSLAAALAVPFTLANGTAFPYRNLLLFITFVVIFITLVAQGLSLKWVIKKLKIAEEAEVDEQDLDLAIKLQLAQASLDHLYSKYADEINSIEAYIRIKERYERMAANAYKILVEGDSESSLFVPAYRRMLKEIITAKRTALLRLRKEQLYSDEMIRSKEWELDLEEARLDEA